MAVIVIFNRKVDNCSQRNQFK